MTASTELGRERSRRLVVIGMSTGDTCGVRDHATLLAEALQGENVRCSLQWLNRREPSFAGARSEISAWARGLADELSGDPPDAVLVHYSVFAHSHRGFPVFVAPMVSAVRRSGVPMITFLHELAFRQRGRTGLTGAAWSLSQRAALFGVMRASAAAVVTVDERVDWLGSRVWLPRRPLAVAPVFSTLPAPTGALRGDHDAPLVGLFGYASCRAATVSLVLDALALLAQRGVAVRLMLLGAPGPDSDVAAMWQSAARSRALASALCLSGIVSSQELSDQLAGCDLLLFADRPGPTSRKTTLAGSLASGTAVVAIDGPASWRQLVEAEAAELAQPNPGAVAGAIERLLREHDLREALGARGRAFAEQSMGVALSAAVVAGLLRAPRRRAGRGAPRA
jgi:hypothetical protein